MSRLVIFVHGLGASDENWWGSTRELLEAEYQDTDTELVFFTYNTEKTAGLKNKIKSLYGKAKVFANFNRLGNTLSTLIRDKIKTDSYDEIKLFGHSMGGVVIASALWSLSKKYPSVYKQLSTVALCGTPLGGSNIASLATKLFFLFPSSHTEALSVDSKELLTIVNTFQSCVSLNSNQEDNIPQCVFFIISDDEVVESDKERFGSFPVRDVDNNSSTKYMNGGHVGAVQNLTKNSLEYKNILEWINEEINKSRHNNSEMLIPDEWEDEYRVLSQNIYMKDITKHELRTIYLIYKNEPEYDSEGFRKRPYIDMKLNSRKTYLKNSNVDGDKKAIVDFKRIIKVVDNTRNCEFEFSNGFLKGSKYATEEFLADLLVELDPDAQNDQADRFRDNVLNVAYKINGKQSLNDALSITITSDYESDAAKGIRIVCNIGEFAIGTEIEFLVSLTLPVNIWDYPTEKDLFFFPITALKRQYVIQEEIYGVNRPFLNPSIIDTDSVEINKERSLYYNRYVFTDCTVNKSSKVTVAYKMVK
ncbi:MAG: Unknown protein [uncultured Sulfurovum sp.]|uniref:DUF676 domain-containing protein n=1 Tax=uncultured Sulfurovum sp. TaxID=269237 RepID=A0A6S6UF89_9BACT|nr:MAG: Unknown protein [uncultured Sulfurovum sp.]